jgi:voltage-gated sodium channel
MTRLALRQRVESRAFETTIAAVIAVNAIVIGAQTYSHDRWLALVNAMCLVVFIVELALRIAAYGKDFVRSGWNWFDSLVIAVSLIPGVGAAAQIARIARLARVVRLLRFLPDARVLLAGAARAVPALASLLVLTGLLIFLYAVLGVELFGAQMPGEFGTLGSAALTLFVMLSLENFPDTLAAAMAVNETAGVLYVLSYVVIGAFLVFNLLIGIVITALEEARSADNVDTATDLAEELAGVRAALDRIEGATGVREA